MRTNIFIAFALFATLAGVVLAVRSENQVHDEEIVTAKRNAEIFLEELGVEGSVVCSLHQPRHRQVCTLATPYGLYTVLCSYKEVHRNGCELEKSK